MLKWTCEYTSGVDLQQTFGDELSAGWKGWVVFCDDNPIALINDNLPEEGRLLASLITQFLMGTYDIS